MLLAIGVHESPERPIPSPCGRPPTSSRLRLRLRLVVRSNADMSLFGCCVDLQPRCLTARPCACQCAAAARARKGNRPSVLPLHAPHRSSVSNTRDRHRLQGSPGQAQIPRQTHAQRQTTVLVIMVWGFCELSSLSSVYPFAQLHFAPTPVRQLVPPTAIYLIPVPSQAAPDRGLCHSLHLLRAQPQSLKLPPLASKRHQVHSSLFPVALEL